MLFRNSFVTQHTPARSLVHDPFFSAFELSAINVVAMRRSRREDRPTTMTLTLAFQEGARRTFLNPTKFRGTPTTTTSE